MASLEELLLRDLEDTGVFDLAASVGMVGPGGRLQHSERPEGSAEPPGLPHPAVRYQVDPSELHAANEAVAGCLRAAEAASVALRLAELQLEQWSHAGEASLGSPAAGAEPAAGPDHAPSVEPAASETPSGAAPEAAAGVPKRKRAGRTAPAASATSGGDAPTPSGGGGAAARAAAAAAAAAGGKGLRHFSLKVCEKVEEKGDTTYEEVANDLIADLAAEVAAGIAESAHDEKNIRRRVYDALNVLEAIGMIEKTKKSISWRGWPSGLGRSAEERLRAERAKALERLQDKCQALQDAIHKAYCLSNLALRNGEAPLPLLEALEAAGLPSPTALRIPFMLVRADGEAEVLVEISADQLTAHIDFQDWPFVLYDDDRVMKLMGLHTPQPRLVAQLHEQQAAAAAAAASSQRQQQQQQQQMPGTLPIPGQPQLQRVQQQQQPQQQQQQQFQQQQQQQQQQQHMPLKAEPLTGAGFAAAQAPLPPARLEPAAELKGLPRLAPSAQPMPGRPAAGQPPTPALQLLSPSLSSPTAAGLGTSVSSLELSSPQSISALHAPAGAGAAGSFSPHAQQQQQQQQQPMLRPATAVGNPEPPAVFGRGNGAAGGGLHRLAQAGPPSTAWPAWPAGGAPFAQALQQAPLLQAQPQVQAQPQLRPAAQLQQLQQLQQLHMQMQPALQAAGAAVPRLQPARPQP